MKSPDIVSTIKDEERNITYRIVAYRTLSRPEKVAAVRSFHSQKRKPKIKNGSTVTILTIIGHDAPGA